MKNRLDLNKKPIFLAADFATEEMCSFQDRSDATETPNTDRLSHIFRVFEPKRISGRFLFLLLEITKRGEEKNQINKSLIKIRDLLF